MDESSQPEDLSKFSKKQLSEKLRKGIGHLNPQILDDPNYQETNQNIPLHAKRLQEDQAQEKQRLESLNQEQRSRRTIIGTIGTGIASLFGMKPVVQATTERLQSEADYREKLRVKNEQLSQKEDNSKK